MTSSTSKQQAPYGVWPSAISAQQVAAGAAPLTQLALGGADGSDVFWLEGRAGEGGRNTLLRRRGGRVDEITPAPWNVRNRVHEYGGGAYTVAGETIYFSHFLDNRLYCQHGEAAAQAWSTGGAGRYADFIFDAPRQRLIGVRELHAQSGQSGSSGQPVNTLCAIGPDGVETVLADGHDFYAAPRLSPDGSALAWLSWDQPLMPWQGTQLWLAAVLPDGTLATPRLIAGSATESVCQPVWSPDGVLHCVSDRSGWWNLYRLRGAELTPLCPLPAEFGAPHWTFGVAMYGFSSSAEIICTYIENGVSHLARLSLHDGALHTIATPYQEIRELQVGPGCVVLLGGAPAIALEVARIDLASGELEVLARSLLAAPDALELALPASISFPTSGGRQAHAFLYRPHSPRYAAAPDSLPPMIVISHGGPTSMASNTLKLPIQYWTSRGFAVLDVNYGGSSGFGRAYRDALCGQWGIVDVDDCIAAARHVVAQGWADPERLLIRGGSAGGFTTLCALTFHDLFKAGASYYGVSDLHGLDQDSHKFESHYLRYLIAPGLDAAALYQARSPILNTERLQRPMIFFQGLDDKVVPPQQSEVMVAALKARGVPVAYVALEGEGHGFRKAENIAFTLEAELYFYLRILKLCAPGAAVIVHIDNLPAENVKE